jgi:hypothetical protein
VRSCLTKINRSQHFEEGVLNMRTTPGFVIALLFGVTLVPQKTGEEEL